jgi:hypothetical protein
MDLLIQRFINNEENLKSYLIKFEKDLSLLSSNNNNNNNNENNDSKKKLLENEKIQFIELYKLIQLRVLAALKIWLDKHFYDFSNNIILTKLILFIDTDISKIKECYSFVDFIKKTLSFKLTNDESEIKISLSFDKNPDSPIL